MDEAAAAVVEERVTVVRIKRLRDEVAAPHIILEAMGTSVAKRPRPAAEAVLLQLQGLSVDASTSSSSTPLQPPASSRRRFVRVHTLEAAAFQGKSEQDILRMVSSMSSGPSGCPTVAPQQRQPVKGPLTASSESYRAGLREAHQQACQAARYKQIRGRRESTQPSLLHLYDLEVRPPTQRTRSSEKGPLQQQQEQQVALPQPAAQPPPPQQQRQPTREEVLIMQHYGPMVEEFLAECGAHQPDGALAVPSQRALAPAGAADAQPAPATASAPVGAAGASDQDAVASTPAAAGALNADAGPDAAAGDGDDAYVYDVYLPFVGEGVLDDERLGTDQGHNSQQGATEGQEQEDDPFTPVIEVAEDDDEFFWALVEQESRAREGGRDDDHDSDDSNAESFYANTYPDEEDERGAGRAGSDEDDDGAYEDAGYMQGYGSGRGDSSAESGSDGEGGAARRRPKPLRHHLPLNGPMYRNESDDYSEHSSCWSDEDERERRRRGVFMH